jgi:acetoin utilization protein AcuB
MRLRDLMTTPVLTVTTALPAGDAFRLMHDARVRHAVVLLGSEIVGVISERDLGGAHGGLSRAKRCVEDLMQPDPVLASPEASVEEAVHLVRERRIGSLPIVEHGRLVGIVTRSDLLRAFDPHATDADVEPESHELDLEERPEPLAPPDRERRL